MQTKQFPAIEMVIMIAKHTTMKYRIISAALDSSTGHDTFAVVVLVIVTVEFTIVVVVQNIVKGLFSGGPVDLQMFSGSDCVYD